MGKNKLEFNPRKYLRKCAIVDASVILKAFLKEEWNDRIEMLLNMSMRHELTLLSTPLIVFEFLNIISRKSTIDEAMLAYAKFKKFNISIIEPDDKFICHAVSEVCADHKLSYYDASYHALAKDFDAVFLTADKKYYDMMKAKGRVELVG